jgi:hypothetical protein
MKARREPRVALAGLVCLALLGGCATSEAVVGRLTGGKVSGGRDEAVVRDMGSQADAFPLAVAHCARFGRKAQFARRRGGAHVFACVD